MLDLSTLNYIDSSNKQSSYKITWKPVVIVTGTYSNMLKNTYGNLSFDRVQLLTLNLQSFLKGIVHFPILALSIIFIEISSWSANSINPGQTIRTCRLALVYTGGKG